MPQRDFKTKLARYENKLWHLKGLWLHMTYSYDKRQCGGVLKAYLIWDKRLLFIISPDILGIIGSKQEHGWCPLFMALQRKGI